MALACRKQFGGSAYRPITLETVMWPCHVPWISGKMNSPSQPDTALRNIKQSSMNGTVYRGPQEAIRQFLTPSSGSKKQLGSLFSRAQPTEPREAYTWLCLPTLTPEKQQSKPSSVAWLPERFHNVIYVAMGH
jgi:hypothetical protein